GCPASLRSFLAWHPIQRRSARYAPSTRWSPSASARCVTTAPGPGVSDGPIASSPGHSAMHLAGGAFGMTFEKHAHDDLCLAAHAVFLIVVSAFELPSRCAAHISAPAPHRWSRRFHEPHVSSFHFEDDLRRGSRRRPVGLRGGVGLVVHAVRERAGPPAGP